MRPTTSSTSTAPTSATVTEHHRGMTGASVCGSCVHRGSCMGRLFCDRRGASTLARSFQAS